MLFLLPEQWGRLVVWFGDDDDGDDTDNDDRWWWLYMIDACSDLKNGAGKYREWTSAAILRVACSPQLQLLSSAVLGYR